MSTLPSRPVSSAPSAPDTEPRRLFYGWIVVVCTFTVLLFAYGIQFSFGVFMHSISADTGWDRAQLSLPYSMYVFFYSLLGVVSGRLTDRFGPRIVLTIGGCLLAAGYVLVSGVHALWQLYLALGIIAATGMSAAYVPCNATVVRWFTVRRGLAISITSSGASFGMFIFPPIATGLIAVFGWRRAYLALGLIAAVVIAVCARFVVRDPEQMGLLPDGRRDDAADEHATATLPPVDEWTLAQARHTSALWLLATIFGLTWLVVFMPTVHIVPFAIDLGIPDFRAAMTLSVIGLAGFLGRLGVGTVSDYLGRVPTLGLSLALQAAAFVGFTLTHGLMMLYASAALFGFSYGGITALFPPLVGDFFGRLSVGAIVGFLFAVAGSPAAAGPLIAGYVYDVTRSYAAAFEIAAILNLIAIALLFFLRHPSHLPSRSAG